jgi:hypothetical protein
MADESWIWIHRYVRVVANAASAPSPLKVRQHGKARELFLATHNFDREIQRAALHISAVRSYRNASDTAISHRKSNSHRASKGVRQ